ncbi:EAL domain-containing protein [Massilia sp. P8910]|uniref:EAL and HDOD domain-containing protein n=1 Tax=Massilia antarctica TaxID=2765360 RepID=UPI001E3F5569|nr:EAL domain-containing protein [Massilia antarctica]MCE3605967.1 EAL domain-containing protein [Massilia antarctica]
MSHDSDLMAQQMPVRDFYLGRQPILDRQQGLYGYEMLFRNAPVDVAEIDSDVAATATVIAHTAQLGLEKVIGDAHGFLNVDAEVLMSDIFVFLPRERVVLEIVEGVAASKCMLDRIADLSAHGFRFALDDVRIDAPDVQLLLPMIDYIKLDVRSMPLASLTTLAPRFQRHHKKLIAEKVETREEFEACLDLGFDYFQGYYFSRPAVISGRKLSPSQLTVLELMSLVTSDADNIEIERAVKRDVTLAFNLLRLVNTPAVGIRHRIDSVSQAVTILGRRQLQRWLQIMLYAEPARRGSSMSPLLLLATTRGRLLELLAQRLRPGQRNVAEIAFTVGIMSLMDALFGTPMTVIVEQIPVIDEVAHALLRRTGFFGDLLHLAECIERMEECDDQVMPALRELAISSEELIELEVAAFEWSDEVVRFAI